jgi:hypothetical protein
MHNAASAAITSERGVLNVGQYVPPWLYPRTAMSSAVPSALLTAPRIRMLPAGTRIRIPRPEPLS